MIEVNGLTKSYGSTLAVDHIDLSIRDSGVVGLLGPNGAGKTTTMRLLTGYIPQTSGTAIVAGFDVFESPNEVKRRVGYLPETPPLYPELAVGEYLQFVAELRGISGRTGRVRVGEVMEIVGLTGSELRRLEVLSKGYRQRVGLAAAIIHRPSVLILDEPTTGLDPSQLVGVRDLIKTLGEESLVLLSTHILSEVQALCSRIVMIDKGVIVADGDARELAEQAGVGPWLLVEIDGPQSAVQRVLAQLTAVSELQSLSKDGGRCVFSVRGTADVADSIARAVIKNDWTLYQISHQSASLETVFLNLMGGRK